jgi:hypothetical protein
MASQCYYIHGTRYFTSDKPTTFMQKHADRHEILPGWTFGEWRRDAVQAGKEALSPAEWRQFWEPMIEDADMLYAQAVAQLNNYCGSGDLPTFELAQISILESAQISMIGALCGYHELWRAAGMHGASVPEQALTSIPTAANEMLLELASARQLLQDFYKQPMSQRGLPGR